LEFRELNYIIVIAEEGSIPKAAQRLYIAQASLSQFLTKYETNLRTKLFVRTARGVRLTYAGDVFVRYAKNMLLDYHRAENEMWDIGKLKAGRIEFGISSFRGAYLFPKVLRRFYDAYPGIEVIIHEHNSVPLETKIAAGELDMALVAHPRNASQVISEPVMKDEVCIVTNKNHPVLKYVHTTPGTNFSWVDMKDAAKFKFLLSNSKTILGSVALEQFTKCQMPIIAVNKNLTAHFAASMAESGVGLAFTYRSCAVPNPDAVYLSVGPEKCFVDLVLEYPLGGYRSKATKLLSKLLHEFIEKK